MEEKADKGLQAIRQLPKLKSLLNKYRQIKTIQSGLLQLSELASTVTDMDAFYAALDSVIKKVFVTDSFHIVLVDKSQQLTLAYCQKPVEARLLVQLEKNHWHDTLTEMVFIRSEPLHCGAADRLSLKKADKIKLFDHHCTDWLGVPLKRGQQTIGVMALHSYNDKICFDDRDCELLQFISEHLVTAIDRVLNRELLEKKIRQRTKKITETNAQLQREIAERQRAVQIHKVLLSISELTAVSQDIEQFYLSLHQAIETLLPAKNLYIALTSQDNTWIDFPYYSDEKFSPAPPRKFSNGLTELAIKIAEPVLVAQNSVLTMSAQGVMQRKPFNLINSEKSMPKAWLAAPLIEQGTIFGILAIQHYQDENAYHQSDLELIQFVSQHIATAIMRKRTQAKILHNHEKLEQLVNERTQELQAANLKLRSQIEERCKVEAQLYHDAHHDALTKLPNRAMLSDRLSYAMRHLKRHPHQRFAVLFIDLDRFKMINDTLGHLAGDQFLIEIATRLQSCVRDNDILARLGGDEFVVMVDSLQSQDDVEEVAARIISAIEQPFELTGHLLHSSASIGIALSRNHYQDASEILRDADAAMYQAKSLGRSRYVFFDDSMREQLIASMTLEQELRIAIKEKQFELHYQSISDLEETRTIGFEALLRWQHPSKGLLTPSEFLFMAEETGMILEIETWVIEEVAKQLKDWLGSVKYKHAFIGINLSGRHLTQANQLAKLMKIIRANTIEPQRLILEFNESAFEKHTDLALKGLRKLKEFGVKLALDDYGAGLSSFNFLHNYPFEFIKLDRSFIRSINTNEKNLTLVKALNELGTKFGYHLVAEGIESAEMIAKLRTTGCEFGQGYHISRPEKLVKETPLENVLWQANG